MLVMYDNDDVWLLCMIVVSVADYVWLCCMPLMFDDDDDDEDDDVWLWCVTVM